MPPYPWKTPTVNYGPNRNLRLPASNRVGTAMQIGDPLYVTPGAYDTVSGFLDQQPPLGMIQRGNLNLNDRPNILNPDGSRSSTYSMSSADEQGREVLHPGVWKGLPRQASRDEAWNQYNDTGEHFGMFDSPSSADLYANQLHLDQAQQEQLFAPKYPYSPYPWRRQRNW